MIFSYVITNRIICTWKFTVSGIFKKMVTYLEQKEKYIRRAVNYSSNNLNLDFFRPKSLNNNNIIVMIISTKGYLLVVTKG